MSNCAEPTRLLRGPQGAPGTNGTNGTNGADAFTTLSAAFTVPAVGATAVAAVISSTWITIGQPLFLQNGGVFYVTALPDSTHVTLQNPGAETGNVAPGTVVAGASKLSPSGFKGAAGTAGGAGTGVTVATKGDIQTFAGAPANLPVGTDGQLLRSLSTAGTGLDWEQIIPNASGTTDNLISRFDAPAGTEKPANLQTSSIKLTDNGSLQHTGGNAKGTDAVDLSPSRALAAQVASGNNAVVGGGRNNKASGADSAISGGHDNEASGANSSALSGHDNLSSGNGSFIGGGSLNTASNDSVAIAGGSGNTGSAATSSIGGGSGNTASGQLSAIAGGILNTASGYASAIGGGESNVAGSTDSFVGGGNGNQVASSQGAFIPGGISGYADKYCQLAHASGSFAAPGDAQVSELIWRVTTTDATANVEMFLDGSAATKRATVPNNKTWAFSIIGLARRSNGDSITFEVKGGIKNDAGTTVLVAAVTAAVVADGTAAALTIANFVVDADNGNDSLRIRVTGIAAQTWRWVAHARIVECGH